MSAMRMLEPGAAISRITRACAQVSPSGARRAPAPRWKRRAADVSSSARRVPVSAAGGAEAEGVTLGFPEGAEQGS